MPAEWDERKQTVRGRVKFAADINARLDIYDTSLKRYAYQVENSGAVLTEAMLRQEVERIRIQELGRTADKSTPELVPGIRSLAEFLADYERMLPGGLSDSTARQIGAIRQHLDGFAPGLNWYDLKINTLNQLKNYWMEEVKLSDNSVASYFGSLRGALKYAIVQGYPVPADYTLVSGRPAEVIRPALTRGQLNQLGTAELPVGNNSRAVSWLFQMACYTGLRHSDLGQLRLSSVRLIENQPCLVALQQKARATIALPLVEEAVRLLNREPDGFVVPGVSDYNDNLRRIGRMAGLLEPVSVSSRYKGKLLHSALPLCDTLTSHTARRTFASLMSAGGLNTKVLQQLMGHSSLASTEKYIKLPSSVVLSQTLNAWKNVE